MDASLPVLVTRLPDRRALARLVRAALRHEVAQVQLAEGPRKAQPHTLDLRVSGSPPVSLIAEPAGAGQNGQFPLRLRPLHRAQAAELYALLEAENVSSEPNPHADAAKSTDPMVASRVVKASDLSAPIARAMSGSAPPPVTDTRANVPQGLPADPKRTAPSASWNPPPKSVPPRSGSAPPATVATPGGHAWAADDDPKRTRPSASWNPPPTPFRGVGPPSAAPQAEPPPEPHAADAPDGTLSVSVVFEPDDAHAMLGHVRPPSSPADDEGPSLSVSVVFEPDAFPGGARAAASEAPAT
ncbi:MAG TPA: hypothetical protein VIF62_02505, partial [Labilithrix sp.]